MRLIHNEGLRSRRDQLARRLTLGRRLVAVLLTTWYAPAVRSAVRAQACASNIPKVKAIIIIKDTLSKNVPLRTEKPL